MQKKLTITISPDVYDGLQRVVGRGNISQFIEGLVRPHVTWASLEDGYRQLAEDRDDASSWREWSDQFGSEVTDEPW